MGLHSYMILALLFYYLRWLIFFHLAFIFVCLLISISFARSCIVILQRHGVRM